MGEPGRVRCALLSTLANWPGEVLFACSGLELVTFDAPSLGLPAAPDPFSLPVAKHAQVGLVTSWWYRWLIARHGDIADRVLRELEKRVDVLVGVDGPDVFSLSFPPEMLRRLALTIKLQGLYSDRELYNYAVGPGYAGGNWTRKQTRLAITYSDADLDRLRISVPCFINAMPGVRRRIRGPRTRTTSSRSGPVIRWAADGADTLLRYGLGAGGERGRGLDVHCLVGLTHVQRIEAMRILSGLSGRRGIVGAEPSSQVSGTGCAAKPLPHEIAQNLDRAANPFRLQQHGRLQFLSGIRRHRVGFAPTGHGELTFRHGEILMSGAALVCQDLRHVETLMPLEHGKTAIFCRPDLADLREQVEMLLSDDELRKEIGAAGRRAYLAWARNWRQYVDQGIEAHIREAVGSG